MRSSGPVCCTSVGHGASGSARCMAQPGAEILWQTARCASLARTPQEQVGKGKWQRVLRDLRAQPCTETCQQDCPAAPLPAAHTNHQVGPRSCSEQLCWCDLLTSDCWLPKKMNYYLRKRTKIGGSSVERCSYFFEEMLVLGSRGKAADSRLVRIWFITAD